MIFQSIIFEDQQIQISYYDPRNRNVTGFTIQTDVINPLFVEAEAKELIEAATQLVTAWAGEHRNPPAPGGMGESDDS